MFKTQRIVLSIIACLVALFILSGHVSAEGTGTPSNELDSVKGKVKGFANPKQSKTISIDVKKKGVMVFKYDDNTRFENFKYITELKGQTVVLKYNTSDPDKLAVSIKKAFAKVPEGAVKIKFQDMLKIVEKGPESGIYIIDARPAKRYEEGHIPWANSIPFSKLKKEGMGLLPLDKSTQLVLYCGGPTCGMSPKAAGLALKWGYENVKVFLDGEPQWKKSGYCTTSTTDFIVKGNVVLVDLRSTEAVINGHIPGAVNIPLEKLNELKVKLPSYKGAHIVFYSDKIPEIRKAVRTARQWGYKNSTIFLGGTDAWVRNGLALEKGPASTEISYTRRILPGEISIADFKKDLESGSSVIVDVRTPTEFVAGHFKNAVNIEVDEIAARHAELPRDRQLIAHCITGVRSEMAFNILKEQGYNVKFLNAEPVFSPDGTYTITE